MKKMLVVFLMGVLVGLAIPVALHNSARETAPSPRYVRRVIGLPDDQVQVRDGVVWVNDTETEATVIRFRSN